MSPARIAPRPSAPLAQCSTAPPAKCPPHLINVKPSAIVRLGPSQNTIAASGRCTHCLSAAWMYSGTFPNARLHSTIVV
jgi:hypothetical protein